MTESAGDAGSVWELPAEMPWDGSNWPAYEDDLYRVFSDDFLTNPTYWRGQRVGVQRDPLLNGKVEGFWHVATETGPTGQRDDRVPDLQRCSRIRWVKAVLVAPSDSVRTFGQVRNGNQHYGVALPDFSYIVFLRQWPTSVQLKTAYYVGSDHKRARFEAAWQSDKR